MKHEGNENVLGMIHILLVFAQTINENSFSLVVLTLLVQG